MNKVELYIKEKDINISELERKLELPSGSIRITGRGIPKVHLQNIISLLERDYGYKDDSSLIEVDIPEKGVVRKKMYNEGRIPDWHDGIARFRDPENGIWKRFKDWCIRDSVDKATGEIKKKITPGFEPATPEIFEDKIGKYTICVNGIKVYKFEKN